MILTAPMRSGLVNLLIFYTVFTFTDLILYKRQLIFLAKLFFFQLASMVRCCLVECKERSTYEKLYSVFLSFH